MIVCSCNVLTDHDVRVDAVGQRSRAAHGRAKSTIVWVAAPQCGRCARTIRRIMDEALGAAADRVLPNASAPS